jgi:hypothetical protein
MERAKSMVMALTAEPIVGETYEGTVKSTTAFGAFVEIMPGTEALLHISELRHARTEKTEDVVKKGDKVKVKLIDRDERGRLRLSMKALQPKPEGMEESQGGGGGGGGGGRPPRDGGSGGGGRDRGHGGGRHEGSRSESSRSESARDGGSESPYPSSQGGSEGQDSLTPATTAVADENAGDGSPAIEGGSGGERGGRPRGGGGGRGGRGGRGGGGRSRE